MRYSNSLTREQSREADRYAIQQLGIPGIVLMENAGRGCAEKLLQLMKPTVLYEGEEFQSGVVVCCGGGNNGGDGFVIARHLFNHSIPVKVVLFASPEKHQDDAATNLRILERLPIRIVQFDSNWSLAKTNKCLTELGRRKRTSWIIDALLGTGAIGRLREPLDSAVSTINALPARRMAIDIPTGIDCDTGNIESTAIKADLTCTFIGTKQGFKNPIAMTHLGHVSVVGIGAPKSIAPNNACD